jgi:cystathionine gamma-synthase
MSDQTNGRDEALGFATRAIHAGFEPDPQTGAVNVPIYASSTFAQDGVGGMRGGYEYARTGNPTRAALEANLAALENGAHGRAFSSGMAATDAALRTLLRPGDHLVIPDDAYGGTFRLIDKVFTHWGISYTPVAVNDVDAVRAAIRPETKVVWVETPTNPLLNVADVEQVAEVAHAAGARFVVDNTFASPYLQQPLALGADVVLHSTTKYLGGHSDVVGGALVTDDAELDAGFAFLQNGAGGVPGPFDAYLTFRGATPRRSSTSSSATRPWRRCSTPACPSTPGTRSQHGRCVASAAWSRCGSREDARRRSTSARGPASSRSRRASAASSRSSSTRVP